MCDARAYEFERQALASRAFRWMVTGAGLVGGTYGTAATANAAARTEGDATADNTGLVISGIIGTSVSAVSVALLSSFNYGGRQQVLEEEAEAILRARLEVAGKWNAADDETRGELLADLAEPCSIILTGDVEGDDAELADKVNSVLEALGEQGDPPEEETDEATKTGTEAETGTETSAGSEVEAPIPSGSSPGQGPKKPQ